MYDKPFQLVFGRFLKGKFHVIIITPLIALGKLFCVKISDPSAALRMTNSPLCHAEPTLSCRAPICHVERSRNISHKIKTEDNCPPFFSDYLSTFWNVPFGPKLLESFELVTVKKLRSFEILKFTVNLTMPPINDTSNE